MDKLAFKLQGEIDFQGLDIAVENRKGSVRSGKDKDGTPWRTKMKFPYGYIRGTKGADGDEVDCYVGPCTDAENAYVVHQKKDDGSFDEDKVMLGFSSEEEARKAYLAHYDTEKYLGPISEVPMTRLLKMVGEKEVLTKISRAAFYNELDKIALVKKLYRAGVGLVGYNTAAQKQDLNQIERAKREAHEEVGDRIRAVESDKMRSLW